MTLQQIQSTKADAKGIITLTENGITARFVKDIVVAKAIKNGGEFSLVSKDKKPHNAVKVVAVDKQGNKFGFSSVTTASIKLGLNKKTIFNSLRYTGRDVGGYKFEKVA